MKRFHEKTLDCCDQVGEDMVDMRFHGMIDDYKINLESLSVSFLFLGYWRPRGA